MEISEQEKCHRIAEIFGGLYESAGTSAFRAEGYGDALLERDREWNSLEMAGTVTDSGKLFYALLKDYLIYKISAGHGGDGMDAEEMAGSLVADAEKVIDEIKELFMQAAAVNDAMCQAHDDVMNLGQTFGQHVQKWEAELDG